MPQGSIFETLLFLFYINHLPQASELLAATLFADDTNLFYLRKDILALFNTVNNEQSNISQWSNRNKLSLNADETKFTLFHNVRQTGIISLVLPTSKINGTLTKQVDQIKFLGVIFDEKVTVS